MLCQEPKEVVGEQAWKLTVCSFSPHLDPWDVVLGMSGAVVGHLQSDSAQQLSHAHCRYNVEELARYTTLEEAALQESQSWWSAQLYGESCQEV